MRTILWTLVASMAALGVPTAGATGAAGAPGEENASCTFESPGGDFIQFRCPLSSTDAKQQWAFRAEFAGGHDDTSASMTLTLGDAPLECDADSKTRLFGEYGNVSLVCRFQVSSGTSASSVLGVTLIWSHAQYVRTALTAVPTKG